MECLSCNRADVEAPALTTLDHARTVVYTPSAAPQDGHVMLLRTLAWMFSTDLAVDLGTANPLVYVRGEGVVINEPSVVAISQNDHSLLAVGHEAKAMLGRAPDSIQVRRPLRHRLIADVDTTERMLKYFITTVHRRRRLVHPRIVLTVPTGITQVENRAVRASAQRAGAREGVLVEHAMATVLLARLAIQEPVGPLVSYTV